jgi:hypothetical protein
VRTAHQCGVHERVIFQLAAGSRQTRLHLFLTEQHSLVRFPARATGRSATSSASCCSVGSKQSRSRHNEAAPGALALEREGRGT